MPKKKILDIHSPMFQEIQEPFNVKSAEEIAKKYEFKTTNYETSAEKLNKAYEYYPTDKDIYQNQNARLSEQKEYLRRIKQASRKLSNKLEQIESSVQSLSNLLDNCGINVLRKLLRALPNIENPEHKLVLISSSLDVSTLEFTYNSPYLYDKDKNELFYINEKSNKGYIKIQLNAEQAALFNTDIIKDLPLNTVKKLTNNELTYIKLITSNDLPPAFLPDLRIDLKRLHQKLIPNLKELHQRASIAIQTIPPDKGSSMPKLLAQPLILLIIRLANIYEEETGEKPTCGYYEIKSRYSPFYNFVKDCLSISQLSHELKNLFSNIKKALAIRKLRSSRQ